MYRYFLFKLTSRTPTKTPGLSIKHDTEKHLIFCLNKCTSVVATAFQSVLVHREIIQRRGSSIVMRRSVRIINISKLINCSLNLFNAFKSFLFL